MRSLILLLVAGAALAGQAPGPAKAVYRDVTREAGITFQHHADPEKKYIVESMSGGVALFDFDNDGLLDIYFVDSLTVETAKNPKAARSALYRNLGNWKFEDVTDKAGVGHPGWGMGVCAADVDADGWQDLYVTAIGGNPLYRNNRDGRFSDATAQSGWRPADGRPDADSPTTIATATSTSSYPLREDRSRQPPEFGRDKTCEYRGIAVQCGPRGLPGESDFLFNNDGAGRFTDVSEKAGVADPARILRPWHRLVRLQRGRLARPVRGERLERRTSCTSTRRTGRSRTSRSRRASQSARTAPNKAAWVSR